MSEDESLVNIDAIRAEVAEANCESIGAELSRAQRRLNRRFNRTAAECLTAGSLLIGMLGLLATFGPLTLPVVAATSGLMGGVFGIFKLSRGA